MAMMLGRRLIYLVPLQVGRSRYTGVDIPEGNEIQRCGVAEKTYAETADPQWWIS